MRKTSEAPATIKPIQKVHRHETTDTNPDMKGANKGPQTVVWTLLSVLGTCSLYVPTHNHEHCHCSPSSDWVAKDICV